jgi:hypothetical protein
MKNLWKVTFDVKYTNVRSLMDETVRVIANGDGMSAVKKAKRTLVGTSFEDGPFGKDRNKWVTCKYRYAKLTGLELLEKIDA